MEGALAWVTQAHWHGQGCTAPVLPWPPRVQLLPTAQGFRPTPRDRGKPDLPAKSG